jgi:hypothetical protein
MAAKAVKARSGFGIEQLMAKKLDHAGPEEEQPP